MLQHTMSLLKKFHTLIITQNKKKLHFLQFNLHLCFANLYAWPLIFNTLLEVKHALYNLQLPYARAYIKLLNL